MFILETMDGTKTVLSENVKILSFSRHENSACITVQDVKDRLFNNQRHGFCKKNQKIIDKLK